MSTIFSYLNDEAGFSAAECAVSLAVVGAVAAVSAGFLGSFVIDSAGVVSGVADCIRFHSHITTC